MCKREREEKTGSARCDMTRKAVDLRGTPDFFRCLIQRGRIHATEELVGDDGREEDLPLHEVGQFRDVIRSQLQQVHIMPIVV